MFNVFIVIINIFLYNMFSTFACIRVQRCVRVPSFLEKISTKKNRFRWKKKISMEKKKFRCGFWWLLARSHSSISFPFCSSATNQSQHDMPHDRDQRLIIIQNVLYGNILSDVLIICLNLLKWTSENDWKNKKNSCHWVIWHHAIFLQFNFSVMFSES
jgi:hypothetical protein